MLYGLDFLYLEEIKQLLAWTFVSSAFRKLVETFGYRSFINLILMSLSLYFGENSVEKLYLQAPSISYSSSIPLCVCGW